MNHTKPHISENEKNKKKKKIKKNKQTVVFLETE